MLIIGCFCGCSSPSVPPIRDIVQLKVQFVGFQKSNNLFLVEYVLHFINHTTQNVQLQSSGKTLRLVIPIQVDLNGQSFFEWENVHLQHIKNGIIIPPQSEVTVKMSVSLPMIITEEMANMIIVSYPVVYYRVGKWEIESQIPQMLLSS